MKQWQIFLMAGLFLAVFSSFENAEAPASPVTMSSDISSADIMAEDSSGSHYIVATLTLTNTDTTYRTQEVYLVTSWPSGIAWESTFTNSDYDELEDNLVSIETGSSTTVKLIIICEGVCSAGDVNNVTVYAKSDPRWYDGGTDSGTTSGCQPDSCTDTTPASEASNVTNAINIKLTVRVVYDSMVTCDTSLATGDNRVFQGLTYFWSYTLENTGWNTDTYQFTGQITNADGHDVSLWSTTPGMADGKELTGQSDGSSTAVHTAYAAMSIIPATDAMPGVYNVELTVTSTNGGPDTSCDFDVVVPEPDLEVTNTDISFNRRSSCIEATGSLGEVTIYAKVRNNGGSVDVSGVTTTDVGIGFYVDGTQLGSVQPIYHEMPYGSEVTVSAYWNPSRAHDATEIGIPIKVVVDPSDNIEESDNTNNEAEVSYKVTALQSTTGETDGQIGPDSPLSRSSSNAGNSSVIGTWIVSEDGSGVWTVQIVQMNTPVSVDHVHWYLLDVQRNTKTDGLVSDIYGYDSGQGKAVVFIDNDYNCKLNPGDKFEVHPGEADSDLASVSDVSDYSFRMKFEPTGDVIGYDIGLQS